MAKHFTTSRPRQWSNAIRRGLQEYRRRTNLCGGQVTGKTEAGTLAGVEAYTVVDTLNDVEAEALVYT